MKTEDNGLSVIEGERRRIVPMSRRHLIRIGAGVAFAGLIKLPLTFAQQALPSETPADLTQSQPTDTVYVCPMDPDVRSDKPGVCPRCGMTLVAGIPDYSAEYRMVVSLTPHAPKPGQDARLDFAIYDPWKNRLVKNFQIVHERLFHLFLVSRDLEFFVHDHPDTNPDGTFSYKLKFPKEGMYRILADIYPTGGAPQLIAKTIFIPGLAPTSFQAASISPDFRPKDTENMHVELTTDPSQPIAGMKSILYYHLGPTDGIEQYLGAWAHMLMASDDLVDLIHTHPTIADGGPQLQFNLVFPRSRTYRIWTQFQRKGVVNTARFDVPVASVSSLAG